MIAYMPTKRTITVDMTKISGAQALALWYDPRTGKATSAGSFRTSGGHGRLHLNAYKTDRVVRSAGRPGR